MAGIRQADLGLDGSDGLGDLNLVRRTFGEEILPLWQRKPGANVAGGDRVAEIRLGQQYLTLALGPVAEGRFQPDVETALEAARERSRGAHTALRIAGAAYINTGQ
ncbi:hypothetical protein [Streptomyces phaeoluteigriseus]|uniref:hypothetical protein n=1 Tax=Streptomyces phaeoluteigriseus TaxID=114686 RepID=UPI003EB9436C